LGVSHDAASTPGALLRHKTCGPRHGRPATGDLIAYSTGDSAIVQTNPATTTKRRWAIWNIAAQASRGRRINLMRTASRTVNRSTGVYSRVMLTRRPKSSRRPPPRSAIPTISPASESSSRLKTVRHQGPLNGQRPPFDCDDRVPDNEHEHQQAVDGIIRIAEEWPTPPPTLRSARVGWLAPGRFGRAVGRRSGAAPPAPG
jgi:hypothetical protein